MRAGSGGGGGLIGGCGVWISFSAGGVGPEEGGGVGELGLAFFFSLFCSFFPFHSFPFLSFSCFVLSFSRSGVSQVGAGIMALGS